MAVAAATPAVTAPVALRNVLRENFGDTIDLLNNALIQDDIWYE
jgi:hypothetical protein